MLALIATASSLVLVGTVDADHGGAAPALTQNSANCYRSLVQTDDLFCVNSYELPISDTVTPSVPEAWCDELIDQTGCVGNPADPDTPTSLNPGAAFVSMYESTTLLQQLAVPRIGRSLGGIYYGAGHGITWGDSTVTNCVESSTSQFTSSSSSCVSVAWNTADNTEAAQRTQLGTDLRNLFVNLELTDPLVPVGGYVVNNLITASGRIIALETLNVLDRLLPGVFQTESLPGVTTGFTPGTGLQLQTDLEATAVAFKTNLDSAGTELGIPGDALGLLLFTFLGLFAFWVVKRFAGDGSTPLAVVAFLTMMLAGTLVAAVPVSVAAVTGLLLVALAAIYILRKMVFA